MKPRVFGAAFALLLVGGAPAVWLHSRHFESTDDAQIEGHLNAISARITGTVARIDSSVENNHYVEAGTLILELDRGDYDVAVAQARAALNTREATANAAELQVPIVQASAFGQLALTRASESEAVESVAVEEANLAAAQHRVEHDLLVAVCRAGREAGDLPIGVRRARDGGEGRGGNTGRRSVGRRGRAETDRAGAQSRRAKTGRCRIGAYGA